MMQMNGEYSIELSYNTSHMINLKYTIVFVFILVSMNKTYAQEAFLRLDSVVIVQEELAISKVSGRSYEYEGHDTIQVAGNVNQLVKVRYCGITVRNESQSFGSDTHMDTGNEVYDLQISTLEYNLMNILDALSYKPTWIDNYSYIRSRARRFENRPEIFLNHDESLCIDYVQSFYQHGTRSVSYRIELIYYSYE